MPIEKSIGLIKIPPSKEQKISNNLLKNIKQ